jgi:hypothetical protein
MLIKHSIRPATNIVPPASPPAHPLSTRAPQQCASSCTDRSERARLTFDPLVLWPIPPLMAQLMRTSKARDHSSYRKSAAARNFVH